MFRKLRISGLVLIFATIHLIALPGDESTALRLDGTFLNQYKTVPGSDSESIYETIYMQYPNYYTHAIAISLTDEVSYEVKEPLTSESSEAKPYYGTWLYGGAAKIPFPCSVIQVDESEVPSDVLNSTRRYHDEERALRVFFKVVIDANRDTNFNNDQAFYILFWGNYYSAQPPKLGLKIPVEYVANNTVVRAETHHYLVSLRLKQPLKDLVPESINIQGREAFEATLNFGNQTLKTWLIDENLNGAWDSADLWVIDLDTDGEWDLLSRFSIEKFRLNDAVNIGGKNYQLTRVNPATKTLTISLSERHAEPREVFGVGSKAPSFVRTDILSRKMITSLDLRGKPYIIYYLHGSNPQQIASQLDTAVRLIEKYIGLNNVHLIIAFGTVNIGSIIKIFPSGNLPYYVVSARLSEYDTRGRQQHLMHDFKIDPDRLQSNGVLIAVDSQGMIRYMSKYAGAEQIVELCEVFQSEITKEKESLGVTKDKRKKATIGNLFGLLGGKKQEPQERTEPTPTPTPEATPSFLVKLPGSELASLSDSTDAPASLATSESAVRQALNWFKLNRNQVDKALAPGRIFYQAGDAEGYGVHSKTFGEYDAIRLPGIGITTGLPRLSSNRETLYLKIYDLSDNASHILELTPGEVPKDLIRIKGIITYYDISPDKKEIAFAMKKADLYHVYRQRVDDGEMTRFTDEDVGGVFPAYSPDGKSIAYCAHKKIRLKDIETAEERILVDDDLAKELPAWSPDGNWIVYQASAGDEFSYDIYKVKLDTGEVLRLTKELGVDANPCFSANGSMIAFVSERETGNNNQTLFIMDADGTQIKRDPSSKPQIYFPRW